MTKEKISWLGYASLALGVILGWFYFPFFSVGLILYAILSLKAERIIWCGEQNVKWVVRILSGISILVAVFLLFNYFKII